MLIAHWLSATATCHRSSTSERMRTQQGTGLPRLPRKGQRLQPSPATPAPAPPPTLGPVSFVPVEVISTVAKPKLRAKQGSPGVVARIATGGWQVEVFADCRPETLKCLLKVLREVAP